MLNNDITAEGSICGQEINKKVSLIMHLPQINAMIDMKV